MTNFITENTTPVSTTEEDPAEQKDPAKEYRIKLVEGLIGHVKRRTKFSDEFKKLFGGFPGNSDTNCYLFVEDLFDDQIKFVAEIIGDSKDGLGWFIYDNKCGDKGLEAGFANEKRRIKTVDDYLWLVDLDKEILSK